MTRRDLIHQCVGAAVAAVAPIAPAAGHRVCLPVEEWANREITWGDPTVFKKAMELLYRDFAAGVGVPWMVVFEDKIAALKFKRDRLIELGIETQAVPS